MNDKNEPVLLVTCSPVQAELFTPILEDEHIPFSAMSNMGAGFTLWAGHIMEEISIYVPAEHYEAAAELWQAYASEQETVLGEGEADVPSSEENAEASEDSSAEPSED